MAKISMFLSFFLFVLIAMPTSSWSGMMILDDDEIEAVKKCVKLQSLECLCEEPANCPDVYYFECKYGHYTPCCGCLDCCPGP
ncbi:hypothetical protein MKW94_029963 [Papaver nudicaule]|uniref:Uncharacterized protein n=1 Tax=Papaver nudicaule TaxID=74823 RepID=A0AA41SFI8_PAPNU|nr:hypothetical protein [Papaver nudicaule]